MNSLDLINHVCIAVTWDCNLKCKFCSIWKKRTHEFLDPDEFVKQALDSGLRYPTFMFFGGEPTLHPQIVELYKKLKPVFPNSAVSIVSNGFGKAAERFEELAKVSDHLITCISIDGDRDKHDEHRGVKGSYDAAINSMDVCKKVFKIPARVSYTITPDNIEYLSHAAELVNKYGSDLSLRTATDGNYFEGEERIIWTKRDIDRLEKKFEEIYPTPLCHSRFVYAIPDFLRTGEHLDCIAPNRSLTVYPNLDTAVCHSLPPICKLKDIKKHWYKDKRHLDCINSKCFTRTCFIDSMYSIAYV